MQLLIIPVLAFAPGTFWLWIVYRWDIYQPEPRWLVIRTFLWGVAAVLPVAFIEFLLEFGGLNLTNMGQMSLGAMAYHSFIVAGLTEEVGKFLIVFATIYKSPCFDESTDGIVYASAAALGFASLENVFYMFSMGWEVILLRGPISTMAHVLFSVIWGYPLALRKLKRRGAMTLLLFGLLAAMAAHGLFNFVLFTQNWFALLIFPIIAGLSVVLGLMLRHSRRISTFKDKVAEMQLSCPNCNLRVPLYSRFCIYCGVKIDRAVRKGTVACGNCGAMVEYAANFCPACGYRLVRKAGILPK
ncbi:MAG TPA: PrsW family intramembrane metalloprotease [Dehalococcoidia bacterium]|nr:PrsW family intramembrane metalloprotease [Dehalococcoidia bacterium]